ncbi:ZIP family metal transporter [Candidatus Woesearchaeota archaeon]|nr:ZIP family metal transporter [Candidatus Woesearchaeota archaeon]
MRPATCEKEEYMNALVWILTSVFIVSLISLIGALTLVVKQKLLFRLLPWLVAFAAGGMLGAAFFDLIPEALEGNASRVPFLLVVAGILLFFVLEKFLYWYHCHKGKCDVHTFQYLNLVGDSIHNFLDGVIIAATFLADYRLGIITSLAVVFHEIPQELGDFGVLVYGGFSARKALFYNFLVSLTSVLGALLGYYFGIGNGLTSTLVAFAAGGFIYIAAADLLPELHKEHALPRAVGQFLTLLLGLGVIWMLTQYLHV